MPAISFLTAADLRHLDLCERRVWMDRHGDLTLRDDLSPAVMQQFADPTPGPSPKPWGEVGGGVGAKFWAGEGGDGGGIFVIDAADWEAAQEQTRDAMQQGAAIIHRAALSRPLPQAPGRGGEVRARVEWLRRITQPSALGKWAYEPLEIRRRNSVAESDLLQLDLDLWLLEAAQGAEVTGWLWLGRDNEGRPIQQIETIADAPRLFAAFSRALTLIDDGAPAPPVFLTDHCQRCPWFSACTVAARDERAITLLPGLTRKVWEQMRADGIVTFDDLAAQEAHSLARFSGIGKTRAQELHDHARSLASGRPVLRQPLPRVARQPGVMLDIETRLDDGIPWCFGWQVDGGPLRVAVVARHFSPHDGPLTAQGAPYALPDGREIRIIPDFESGWRMVAADAATHGGPVYHWSGYEQEVLKRFGPQDAVESLLGSLHDLHRTFRKTVTIPVRGTSLKKVGPYLGYHWPPGATALSAWADYQAWLLDGDRDALARACAYQAADVEALDVVWRWLAGQ